MCPSSRLPALSTSRLLLRAPTEEDAASYQTHFVDYEVIRYLASTVPWPYPQDGVLHWLRTAVFPKLGDDQWLWGIFRKEQPAECVGAVELWRLGRPEHRGFWLGRSFWGKGYMTEATDVITDYAFEGLGFETLVLSNAVGNVASRRIKEKAGACLLRTELAAFVDPALTTREVWELSKEAWQRRTGA